MNKKFLKGLASECSQFPKIKMEIALVLIS
jgi:hypothetical protein